jgi:uncharacterized protein (TIGR02301 family)
MTTLKRLLAATLCAAAAYVAPEAMAPGAAAQTPRDVTNERIDRTYSAELGRLSTVLGGAHYIRRLCSNRRDMRWYNQMRTFMDLEGQPGTPQRSAMVQGFNAGYREQEVRYPRCSPEAERFESQLQREGGRLAKALAARYRD